MGSEFAGCCQKSAIEEAGSEIGTSLLKKGKSSIGQKGSKIMARVESTFDDKVDKIISEKLLERCDTTFDSAIDSFVDKAFTAAMNKFDPGKEKQSGDPNDDDEAVELKQRKAKRMGRLEKARERLRDYGLPTILIDTMEQEGWLDERNWEVLTKDQLQAMNFADGHIELFMGGITKNKQAKNMASGKLKRWGIPQSLINKMDEDGYLDETRWEALFVEALECEAEPKKEDDNRKRPRRKNKRNKNRDVEEEEKYGMHVKLNDMNREYQDYPAGHYLQLYHATELHRIGFEYQHIESFLRGMQMEAAANKPPGFILKKWGIPGEAIEKMREKRVLSQIHWDRLSDDQLTKLGFDQTHIDNWHKKLQKRLKLQNQKTDLIDVADQAEEEIRKWGIPPVLVDRMKEVGWIHPEFWDDLLVHEYELQDLGFQNGHISTFRRKFQEWKEEQDSKATQRKMKLLRKLEKPPKKQSALLKRNIDIFNAMDEPVKVRIISERKYGSMESTSGSQSLQKDKATLRKQGKSQSSRNKSITDGTSESTSDSTKERSFKGGASAQVSATPVNASLNVEMNKKDTLSKTNKSTAHAENEREAQRQSNDERSNKMSDASAVSAANTSQHSWDKVTVGFTHIMPNQTIEFPVQISDPNAVVYMTIYSFTGRAPICDNVQIDANYIKIDKVKIEGFGTKVRWQPLVKPPKSKTAGADRESIAAKNGIFTIHGFCNYLENQGIEGKKLQFIKNMLGNAEYDVKSEKKEKEEIEHLETQLKHVLQIYNERNGIKIEKEAEKNEANKIRSNGLIRGCIQRYLNTTLQKCIIKFDVIDVNAETEEEKANKSKVATMKRIDSLLQIDKMCLFLKNKGIAPNKKIDFILESLGGYGATYMLTEKTKDGLLEEIDAIIAIYDKLDASKKGDRNDITLGDYKQKIADYKGIILKMQKFMEDHQKHSAKYEQFSGHRDDDSDDEELHSVEKFFDCDSHSLLIAWGLSQFHERLSDEGWANPLDWVHLDEHILKQNIGFRPGHIQIFNRKFDLWVKRYNDVRRTIDPKRKGKDGVLIVGKGEITTLKSNYYYVFTKVIVREDGVLTVQPWSPKKTDGGVLFIKAHQDIVLEKNARISVDGKGYWGSTTPDKKGYGPGGGGSLAFACNGAGGASYAERGFRGYEMHNDEDYEEHILKEDVYKSKNDIPWEAKYVFTGFNGENTEMLHMEQEEFDKLDHAAQQQAEDDDFWLGEEGSLYWEALESGAVKNTGMSSKDTFDVAGYGWDMSETANSRKDDKQLVSEKHVTSLVDLAINIRKTFPDNTYATEEAKLLHERTLGSGGGCNIEIYKDKHGWKFRTGRGGAGGGAVKIWCDKLIMYEGSAISAQGTFDPYGDPLTGGGSGGSIFISVQNEVIPKNRDPNDKNIGLNARGGGQYNMDRMYLPHTWTEKEEKALHLIRTFEKLEYPRSKIKARKDKAAKDKAARAAKRRPDYIDSDDEDDESSGYWDSPEEEEEEENKGDGGPIEFTITGLCTHLEELTHVKEAEFIKNNFEKDFPTQKWQDSSAVVAVFEKMFAAISERIQKKAFTLDSDTDPSNPAPPPKHQALESMTVEQGPPFELSWAVQYIEEYCSLVGTEEQEVAETKKKFKMLPLAVQIAIIKNEFKERNKEKGISVKEEDLWLWKWKKMPKMPPAEEEEDDKDKDKDKEEEEEKKAKSDSDSDSEDDFFESRKDWEWVGIGGAGVIRFDYHSPFTIGWDNCAPAAFLGTDIQDNAGDNADRSEDAKPEEQITSHRTGFVGGGDED